MNWRERLSHYITSGSVQGLIALALIGLHLVWIGYVIARDKPLDFNVYYMAAYGFGQGHDVYAAGEPDAGGVALWEQLAAETGISNYAAPYRYPPLTALLIWPLTHLSPRLAATLWLLITLLAFIVSAWLLGRTSSLSYGPILALAILLLFVPSLTTLHAGQVNGLLLLSLCLAFYALRRGRMAWVGAGVGIGAMVKFIPLAHLGYLAWRRRWKAVLVGSATVVALFGAGALLVGWDGLLSYGRHLFSLGAVGSLVAEGCNQAINGLLARTVGTTDATAANRLWIGSSLTLVLLTVAVCWPRGGSVRLLGHEFALVTVAACLITPFAWYHQFVLLVIPLFVLTEEALVTRSRRWMLVPLAVGYILSNIHGLIWHHLEPYPLLNSTPLYTALLLWGLLARMILSQKRYAWATEGIGRFQAALE